MAFSSPAQETNHQRRVFFREPQLRRYEIIPGDKAPVPGSSFQPGKQWTQARVDGSSRIVKFGSRIVLQLEPGQDISALAAENKVKLARRLKPGLFILQAQDSESALNAAEKLAGEPGVLASYPVSRRPFRRHNAYAALPNDERFGEQWYLDHRGSDGNLAGPSLNVRAAWPFSRGEGIVVAVVDEGVQLSHPDLASRAAAGLQFSFLDQEPDGGPADIYAHHGTPVAGLIAADGGNQIGVSGVAPNAQIASWVIFGSEEISTDEELMDMFQSASNRVAVQNHSWGYTTTEQLAIDALCDIGISNAVTLGRGGKGVIMVRAGGNSRGETINANDDGYVCDPRVIGVAAVRKNGRACSYSNPGACLLVSAPSGDVIDLDGDGWFDGTDPDAPDVLTTDQTGDDGYESGDFTGFNGTSASSPQVAGVVALILAANTNLTYRDVQHILVNSARHFDRTDPDLRTNSAGFRFSHNAGFGIPDAGFAVQLARGWSNRAARIVATMTNTTRLAIPDDALRVVCTGNGLSSTLTSIASLPSLGPHPDAGTSAFPLVYVGQANSDLTQDLRGKAALIQRGTSLFSEKIERAARAGAALAIIFNNTGVGAAPPLGSTDYVPIPAVGIGKYDGEALRNFLAAHPETTARCQLTPAIYRFAVTNTLVCEHVGIRLKTTHSYRGDVRVTLVSPTGTRSILQTINSDSSSGPVDWTYWSVQHFYEGSAGEWRLEVSDQRHTLLQNNSATGAVTYAQIILHGVPIGDTDRDGLDDVWERARFGHLNSGPKDDPDADGYNNAREQIMGTNPATANSSLLVDLTPLHPGFWRISWPSQEGTNFNVFHRSNLSQAWSTLTNVAGGLPVSEWVVPTGELSHFYRVGR